MRTGTADYIPNDSSVGGPSMQLRAARSLWTMFCERYAMPRAIWYAYHAFSSSLTGVPLAALQRVVFGVELQPREHMYLRARFQA